MARIEDTWHDAKASAPDWEPHQSSWASSSSSRPRGGWTDIRTYIPSKETSRSLWGRIGFIVVILALIFIGVYGYAWATSPAGQRAVSNVASWISLHNPATWYIGKIETAKEAVSSSWAALPNATMKGILFEDFTVAGSAELMQGSPITFIYKLKISEATVEQLPLKMTCRVPAKYIKDAGLNALPSDLNGEILPANPLIVTGKRITDSVRCRFNEDATKKIEGTAQAEATVIFPFETKDVRLKVYFISDSAYTQLGDNEFFSYYKIDENQPIRALYNGEPVEIGIGVSSENEQPIIARTDYPLLAGITLWNRWEGTVLNITGLTLTLPKGLEIDEKTTKNPNQLCPFVPSRTSKAGNEYSLSERFVEGITIEKGRSRSFECWLTVQPELLGDALYTIKEYKASASYIYELPKRQASFSVKSPQIPGASSGSGTVPLVVS